MYEGGHGALAAYVDLCQGSKAETLEVAMQVTTTGTRAGEEVVHLCVHDVVPSVFNVEVMHPCIMALFLTDRYR